jgi:hypothetical protein
MQLGPNEEHPYTSKKRAMEKLGRIPTPVFIILFVGASAMFAGLVLKIAGFILR